MGPGLVISREGAQSYVIEVKPGVHMKAHRSFLKPYKDDTCNTQPIPLNYHQRTEIDVGGEPDEWEMDKVVGHMGEGGKVKFLTTCLGNSPEKAPCRDPGDLLPRYNVEIRYYRESKNPKVDMVVHLGWNW